MTLTWKDPARLSVVRPNILLYGEPKTGKTTAAASLDGGVVYLNLDLDNATQSVRATDTDGRILEPEYEGLSTLDELEAEAKKASPFMDVLVADPIGDLHRKLLEEESRYAVRPSRDAYGDVAIRVERFCREICDAPGLSAVLVCHDTEVKDERTGNINRLPFTGTSNPTLGRKLMQMVDVIAYTGAVEVVDATGKKTGAIEFHAQLVSANGRIAGSRWPGALGKSRLMGRLLPDGTRDPEVRGLAQWVEDINAAMAVKGTDTDEDEAQGAATTEAQEATK